jgi:hypothetical protein
VRSTKLKRVYTSTIVARKILEIGVTTGHISAIQIAELALKEFRVER